MVKRQDASITFRVSFATKMILSTIAHQKGISVANLVREYVMESLQKKTPKKRKRQ